MALGIENETLTNEVETDWKSSWLEAQHSAWPMVSGQVDATLHTQLEDAPHHGHGSKAPPPSFVTSSTDHVEEPRGAHLTPPTGAAADGRGMPVENKPGVGKPLLDPSEFAERIRDTDKKARWIPGAFP